MQEASTPHSKLGGVETSEEHFVSEITSLEKPILHSWQIWAIALAAFGALAIVVAAFIVLDARYTARALERQMALMPPRPMALVHVEDGLRVKPPMFQWERVPDAAGYVLIVFAEDTRPDPGLDAREVVMIRAARETSVNATDVEGANFVPGSYTWSLEARRGDGTRCGYGEGAFRVD